MLPLYPLEGRVLFPGQDLRVQLSSETDAAALARSGGPGGTLIAALADGSSVHEVAVTARISSVDDRDVSLHGVVRCRLLALVGDDVPLARAEQLPDPPAPPGRAERLSRLLLTRYARICDILGRSREPATGAHDLAALTWSVTATLSFTAEQQQGLLNVPDAVTRARLLLATVREIEQRERFLRPWAHLRGGSAWN